ncbi:hypothetical protein NECID01_0338 [Nematocida sp. AWRm77]|nr:hypothetical protein NECID01_0338 [Nematocida sp. AWRm77]
MKVTYKAAEGFCLIAPFLLTYIYKARINDFLTENLLHFRLVFLISVLIDMGMAYWVKKQILRHNVQTKIRFTSDTYIMLNKEKKEKINEKGETVEEDEEEEVEMTVCEYDTQVISTHISKKLSSTLLYVVMHLAFKSPQPIMTLIFNPVKDLIFFPIYIEYIRGKKMLRPFSRNIMFEMGEEKEEATVKKPVLKEESEEDKDDSSSFSISDEAAVPIKGEKAKKEE